VIESTGAILLGRRTYEVEDRDRRGFYGGAWAGPVFVLTHQPPATVPGWMTGTFINEPIDAAVANAQQAASEKNVIILGANVAHQCLDNGSWTRSSFTSRPSCSATASASSETPAKDGPTWSGPASRRRGNSRTCASAS
jgi:dihydrofolate reductase